MQYQYVRRGKSTGVYVKYMLGVGDAAEVEEKCVQTCKSRFRRTEMAVNEVGEDRWRGDGR